MPTNSVGEKVAFIDPFSLSRPTSFVLSFVRHLLIPSVIQSLNLVIWSYPSTFPPNHRSNFLCTRIKTTKNAEYTKFN